MKLLCVFMLASFPMHVCVSLEESLNTFAKIGFTLSCSSSLSFSVCWGSTCFLALFYMPSSSINKFSFILVCHLSIHIKWDSVLDVFPREGTISMFSLFHNRVWKSRAISLLISKDFWPLTDWKGYTGDTSDLFWYELEMLTALF